MVWRIALILWVYSFVDMSCNFVSEQITHTHAITIKFKETHQIQTEENDLVTRVQKT